MKKHFKISIFISLIFSVHGNLVAQVNLSLEKALQLARDNNRSLQVQRLEEQSAKENTSESKGHLLPTVYASGNYSVYFDRQVIFMPGSFVGNDNEPVVDLSVGGKNTFNTMLMLQQPIVSEAARKQIKSSRLSERVQLQTTREKEVQLAMEISSSYYTILLIKESLRLNRQSLERNIRSLNDSRSFLQQGKTLKVDTLRNFIAVENLKTSIAYMESNYHVSLLGLKNSLGIPSDLPLLLTDSLQYDSTIHFFQGPATYDEALSNRPDINKQKIGVELSKTLHEQSRAQRLPVLSLVGAYQLQAQSDDRSISSYRWPSTSYMGLQVTVPIFSGNRLHAKIRQASIVVRQRETQLLDATENAKTEIVSIERKLKEVMRRLELQQKTVAAAQQNYKIINDRYKNGLSSRLELSDAEIAWSEANLNYLRAVYDIKITKLQLDKAVGLLTL